jgi:hypothetical protein
MTNREPQDDVLNTLDREPSIDAGEIDISAEENVAMLTGLRSSGCSFPCQGKAGIRQLCATAPT